MEDKNNVLETIQLTTVFSYEGKKLEAVNNVSLCVGEKEMVGIVGESGCGKSMTAFSILNLVPYPGEIVNGEVIFKGLNLLKLKEEEIRKIRGKEISIVYQDPLSSLNPGFNIYWHLNEVINAHFKKINKKEKDEMIVEVLREVGIPDPEKRVFQYPHQFSGGMRQRVAISMAIILKPSLIIADEPTTALDVTTQKEIFDLIEDLRETFGISFLVISHDLYLIAERCDRVYVMYAGQIVEMANAQELFKTPLHPYTKGLLNSVPKLTYSEEPLKPIKGEVPNLMNLPNGCFFKNRCDYANTECNEPQDLRTIDGRLCRCCKI